MSQLHRRGRLGLAPSDGQDGRHFRFDRLLVAPNRFVDDRHAVAEAAERDATALLQLLKLLQLLQGLDLVQLLQLVAEVQGVAAAHVVDVLVKAVVGALVAVRLHAFGNALFLDKYSKDGKNLDNPVQKMVKNVKKSFGTLKGSRK